MNYIKLFYNKNKQIKDICSKQAFKTLKYALLGQIIFQKKYTYFICNELQNRYFKKKTQKS